MKKSLIAIAFMTCLGTSQVFAYTYTFNNFTPFAITIGFGRKTRTIMPQEPGIQRPTKHLGGHHYTKPGQYFFKTGNWCKGIQVVLAAGLDQAYPLDFKDGFRGAGRPCSYTWDLSCIFKFTKKQASFGLSYIEPTHVKFRLYRRHCGAYAGDKKAFETNWMPFSR